MVRPVRPPDVGGDEKSRYCVVSCFLKEKENIMVLHDICKLHLMGTVELLDSCLHSH